MVDGNLEAASKDVAVVHIEEKAGCIADVAAVGDSTDFDLVVVVVVPMTVDADLTIAVAGYCKAALPDQAPHLLDNCLTRRV